LMSCVVRPSHIAKCPFWIAFLIHADGTGLAQVAWRYVTRPV
jgi:hypothetical protein